MEPNVTETSTREELIHWLVWNDRNGVYTDEDSRAEGYDPLTREEALSTARQCGAFGGFSV